MRRVIVLIDGYNLYHAIDDSGRHDLKWLDLWKLGQLLIRPDRDSLLKEVHYFSAFATWRIEQYARHREYVKALKTTPVSIHLGNFKKKQRSCRNCGAEWLAHEEKESDVNIAVQTVRMAFEVAYEKLILISADTDLTPALRMAKHIHPSGHITLAPPPRRNQYISSLLAAIDSKQTISHEMLSQCQFPDRVLDEASNMVCSRPGKYKP